MTENEEFINPIDPDKVAENPGLMTYPHTVGGAVIKPEDMGKTISNALMAMDQQTAMQLGQIQEQIQLLYRQAQDIRNRTDVSVWIYQSEMGFDPLINHIYHLYKRDNGRHFLSMVAPAEWGRGKSVEFVATVKLLADHTWEIIRKAEV